MYLSDFTYEEIKKRIITFESNDFSKMTPDEIYKSVIELFSKNGVIPRDLYTIIIPKNEMFYRVRKFADKENFLTEQDFWNNPNPPIGRLNLAGEPILYACYNNDPIKTAISEVGITDNELFVIISYKSVEEIEFSSPGIISSSYKSDKEAYDKHILMEGFLKEIFTKQVHDENNPYYYHISCAIAKYFFAFGKDSSGSYHNDAFVYPSVKTKINNNIAFQIESAKKKLKLCGAAIALKNKAVTKDEFGVLGFMTREGEHTKILKISKELKEFILPNYF